MKKKNFNYFKEIDHEPLRIFNITAMFYNLFEDFGSKVAEDYLAPLPEEDIKAMVAVMSNITTHGIKDTRALAVQGMVFEEDLTEEVYE